MRVAGAHAALRAQGLGQERCSRARARLAAAAAAAASAAMTTAAPSSAAPATPPAAPSWAELQAGVLAAGWTPPDLEAGPTSPYSLLRTFGQPGEPRVVLYRDSAAWCPYCQKVWLQLEEKRIPYRVEKINMRCYGDKPASFLRLVPSGLLPVLVLDGRVYTESAAIAALLERTFPATPLLPAEGSAGRGAAEGLLRLERQLFAAWLGWLTESRGDEANRDAFERVAARVEAALGPAPGGLGGPYFLGPDFSLVDIVYTPFMERIAASLRYYKGYGFASGGRWPGVERWFGAMYGRPAYRGTAGDYYSHAHGLPPQLGGCAFNPAGEAGAGALGGAAGAAGAWRLPLPPLTWASSPEPYPAALDRPAADALRAAARLADNAAAVAGFAARGPAHAAGAARRTVASRLCDPSVPPDAAALPEVDAALRRVAARLLATAAGEPQPEAWRRQPLGERAGAVAASLAYMRDRICVPRDLPFPAARQLRAHLNAEIDSVEAEGGGA